LPTRINSLDAEITGLFSGMPGHRSASAVRAGNNPCDDAANAAHYKTLQSSQWPDKRPLYRVGMRERVAPRMTNKEAWL